MNWKQSVIVVGLSSALLAGCGAGLDTEQSQDLGDVSQGIDNDNKDGFFQAGLPNYDAECGSVNPYATGGFKKSGDTFYVKDKSADGQSAFIEWHVSTGRSGTCRNKYGKGAWAGCIYNLGEGQWVTFSSFTCDFGKLGTACYNSANWNHRSARVRICNGSGC